MAFSAELASLGHDAKTEIVARCRVVPAASAPPAPILRRLGAAAAAALSKPPSPPFSVMCIDADRGAVRIPFALARSLFGSDAVPGDNTDSSQWLPMTKTNRDSPPPIAVAPRPHQLAILSRAREMLAADGAVTIQAQPGSGKTFMAISIAHALGLRTAVVTPLETVTRQWAAAIAKFFSAAVVWMPRTPASESRRSSAPPGGWDFAVMYHKRACGIGAAAAASVGLLVIDEAHLICTATGVESLLAFTPRFVIALTATLERVDGAHAMMRLIAGDGEIVIPPIRDHVVVKLDTGSEPEETRNPTTGLLDFTALTAAIAADPVYNDAIVRVIVRHAASRKFIVLCSLISHVKRLVEDIRRAGVTADELCGSKRSYTDSCVIVGTMKKISTGFDVAMSACDFDGVSPNTLIVAHTIKTWQNYVQAAGRIMRADDSLTPVVVFAMPRTAAHHRHVAALRRHIVGTGGRIVCGTPENDAFPDG